MFARKIILLTVRLNNKSFVKYFYIRTTVGFPSPDVCPGDQLCMFISLPLPLQENNCFIFAPTW